MVRMNVSALIPATPNEANDVYLKFASLGVANGEMANLQKRYGGPWVAGTLTISDSLITFAPNTLNDLLRNSNLELNIRPSEIVAIRRRSGFIQGTVYVSYGPVGASYVTFRKFGSKKLETVLRDAARISGS